MPPKLMSPKELAAWLGVPVGTIYRWNSDGCGPRRVTVGRHTRYAEADVNAWLATRTVESAAPASGGRERRDREVARRRKPRAASDGRTAYRDPTGDQAVGKVMRGAR